MIHPELPSAVEAEKAVLGAILLNREAITAVADTLNPDHFYMERHHQIYAAMLACYSAKVPPDIRTVSEELRRRGQLDEVGGIVYMSDLVDATPSSSRIDYYAIDVLRAAIRRRLITVGGQIAAMGYAESDEIVATLEHAHALLDGAGTALHDPRYTPFTAEDLDRRSFPPVAWAVLGMLPEGLTLLVGKPKMRKSWLALAIALAISTGGRALGSIPVEQGDVLYLALEDGARRLHSRQRKILGSASAPHRLSYLTAAPRLDNGCVGIVETWLRKHPEARLIIIDVLAKVRPAAGGRNMYDEDYAALEPLQQLATRRGVSILVVHHMNRSNAEDVFDQISGSNGIGGSADGVLVLQYERGQTDATLHVSGRDIEDDSALALRWDNTTAQWVLLGKADEVKASNERQEIMTLYREEKRAMGPKEVAENLGKFGEYARIKQLMYRMAKDGDLQVTGRGLYTLPALTLIPGGKGNEGNEGDPGPRYLFHGNRTPQSGESNEGDRNPTEQNPDHLDHLVTLPGSEASESHEKGNAADSDLDHLRYFDDGPPGDSLAAAAGPTPDLDWDYIRTLHAAGNLKAIRVHCVMRRQDYDRVLRTLGDIP
jgi:DnaB-like helicase N terminal domain/AAA domain